MSGSTPFSTTRIEAPQLDDEATRHLSVAAHIDEEFADRAVSEFVAEPRRAVPPSPGVDAAAVLRQALVASRRRLVRDAVLVVLFVLLLVVNVVTAMTWLFLGLVWALVALFSRRAQGQQTRAQREPGERPFPVTGAILFALFGLWALLGTDLYLLLLRMFAPLFYSPRELRSQVIPMGDITPGPGVFLILLAALAVLVLDRLGVRHLLLRHFRYGVYRSDQRAASWWDRLLRDWGWRPYSRRIEQVAATAERGNLVVHDGWRAFVGSGDLARSWSIAVRLRTEEDEEPRPLSPTTLYEAVASEMESMRSSDQLAPGFRLRGLSGTPHAVVSAHSLMRYRHEPLARNILPDPESSPTTSLPGDVMREITDRSPEWIRHYRCYRVESWHKELVSSSYLHIGCDERTLYVEWNAFQLNPVHPYYGREDWWEARLPSALGQALVDFLALPASLFRRIRLMIRSAAIALRSVGFGGRIVPSTYGARNSIRELVAAYRGETYFQDMDAIRYVKLMERKAFSAIINCLRDHGYSTEEFEGNANAVINNTIINGSKVSGLVIGGKENQVTVGGANPGQAAAGVGAPSRAGGKG
ncbi:hypothetical protein [Longimycelium tulufanense]|uniref:hypothetical protein n=1 Tax=Longimycelium tulufanense TaxID=907463 RepID=UPI0016640F7D|nr:hypothetical protein [Longimycelium tulufanense]